MISNKLVSTDKVGACVLQSGATTSAAGGAGVFTIQCFGQDGNLKWEEKNHNLVVNQGLKDMNDKYFSGSAYTAAWYLGLITGPGSGTTIAAADTLASHTGWTEYTDYTGNRQAVTFGAATLADPSVISNSASPNPFVITAPGGTVAGAFLASVATGSSGILFSASDFQSPGDRVVVAGDTLNVTYTFSLDAA
jgi:hypothetical protein